MCRRSFALALLLAVVATDAAAAHRLVPIADSSSVIAPIGSGPYGFLRAGSFVFFRADDGTHGLELWRTDGTTEGTVMFDLVPGPEHSVPVFGGNLGDAVLMIARGAGHTGAAVWRSDGTTAGTWKIGTIPPDPVGNVGGVRLFVSGTRVFALAYLAFLKPPTGLWVSDGTVESLKRIALLPTQYETTAPAIAAVNGNLYFIANDASAGPQLWVSDGTLPGTRMLQRGLECVTPGPCGLFGPAFPFRAGATACFAAADGVYRTDGTPEGTTRLIGLEKWTSISRVEGRNVTYLFTNAETIRTDGTAGGTWRFDPFTSAANSLVLDDDRLAVMSPVGDPYNGGRELRITDGTPEQTRIELLPGYPSLIGAIGPRLFLSAATKETNYELWMTDADRGGAALLKDIDPRQRPSGSEPSNPGGGATLGSNFIFAATSEVGREVWITDGTPEGTRLLANIAPDVPGGAISGTVRDAATGVPIAGATITLCNQQQCEDAVGTNVAGFYRFTRAAAGVYTLRASSGTHITQIYDGIDCPCPPPEFGTPVGVTVGFETTGVDFTLTKGGTISGHVRRAATGEPINFARIVVRSAAGDVVDEIAHPDAGGGYRSRGLPTGKYYVESHPWAINGKPPAAGQVYNGRNCALEGCAWQFSDAVPVTAGRDTPGIDFSLRDYGTIAGTLRDTSSGKPAADMLVRFIRKGSSYIGIGRSDAAGRYQSSLLPEGSYYVTVDKGNGYSSIIYPNAACPQAGCDLAAGTAVAVTSDGAVTGIDLRLQLIGARLAGIITDAAGIPVPSVRPILFKKNGGVAGSVFRTDAAGRYETWVVSTGTYYLTVGNELYPGIECPGSGCAVTAGAPIDLVEGQTKTLDIQLRSRLIVINGRVLNAMTGQPVNGAVVQLHDTNGRNLTHAKSGEDGRYTISALSLRPSCYIVARATGYPTTAYPKTPLIDCLAGNHCSFPPDATPIPAGISNDVDFALARFGVISGRVTDASTGLPLAVVNVSFVSSTGLPLGSTRTAADGTYRWERALGPAYVYVNNLPGGPYNGQVYPDRDCAAGTCDPRGGKLVDASDSATITGIDLRLQPNPDGRGRISGRVVDAATGAGLPNILVSARSLRSFSTRTDADGYYILPAEPALQLPDGEFRLQAGNPPYLTVAYGDGAGVLVSTRAPHPITFDFRLTKLQVHSITPDFGPAAGGTEIAVNGTGFSQQTVVMIGSQKANAVSVTPTRIVALTPAAPDGLAVVNVTVIPPPPSSFSVTRFGAFTYIAAAPAAMHAIAGTPQTSAVNTAFGTALQVRVVDASQAPLSGVTVTFAAPAGGASGTFAGNAAVITDANGTATAPPLIANGITGTYEVTATAGQLTATLALTNLPAPPKHRAAGR